MSRPNIHSVLGAIQVLCNAVGVGVKLSWKKALRMCTVQECY